MIRAPRIPRVTLRHLMVAIAVLAVVLAVMRHPLGLAAVWYATMAAGAAVDRRLGGSGFLGGIAVGMFATLAVGIYQGQSHQRLAIDLPGLALFGAFNGMLASLPLWLAAGDPRPRAPGGLHPEVSGDPEDGMEEETGSDRP
ncbi:MAG: hypothetical protein ACYC61_25810 [Isosphaeraceae bacterium]